MTVVLTKRADIDLAAFRRVAWQEEGVEFSAEALDRMAETRKSFLDLIENEPDVVVYGTTSGGGERARFRLSREEMEEQGRRPHLGSSSWGEALP
ncbi:MAG: histidine ammonia-lyase, partial [Actinomycetota bacterium]|nr:histidine ammonia-lyase [Actinomycetota bacterium]